MIYLVALVAAMRLSDLAVAAGPSGEAEAKRIYTACQAKLKAAKSVVGRCEADLADDHQKLVLEFSASRPNLFRASMPGQWEDYCDGKTMWSYWPDKNEYMKRPAPSSITANLGMGLEGFTGIDAPYLIAATAYRMEKFDNRRCAAVDRRIETGAKGDGFTEYFSPETKLPVGWVQRFAVHSITYRYIRLKVDAAVSADTFKWKPPLGAKERSPRRSDGPD